MKWDRVCKWARSLSLVAFCAAACASAADIIATTSNGSTVLLHDNGRWEYYQNNAKIRDVRPSAIPEDAKFQITINYESVDKLNRCLPNRSRRALFAN